MSQKTIVVGNSFALTIPKGTAQKMNVKKTTRFESTYDAGRGIISFRVIDKGQKPDLKIVKLTADFMRRYDKDLRELAKK